MKLKNIYLPLQWDDEEPLKCVFCVLLRSARMNIAGTLVFLLSVVFPLVNGRIDHGGFGTNGVSNSVPSDSSKPHWNLALDISKPVIKQRHNMWLTQSIDCTILRHYLRR